MFHNDKFRLYVFVFLAFAVLSSKNILIYNEETLIALSFFSFVFSVLSFFGDTIKNSLDEKGSVIWDLFQNYLTLQKLSFLKLLNQHQKVSGLARALGLPHTWTQNEYNVFHTNVDGSLKNMCRFQIQNKFKTILFSKAMAHQKLYFLLSEKIPSTVLVSFPVETKESLLADYQNQTIEKANDSMIMHAQTN